MWAARAGPSGVLDHCRSSVGRRGQSLSGIPASSTSASASARRAHPTFLGERGGILSPDVQATLKGCGRQAVAISDQQKNNRPSGTSP